MTGFGPFQAPPQGGAWDFFSRASGRGGVLAGKQRPETPDKAGGGGVGGRLEASEGFSSPPGGLKHGLVQKGYPKYLRGYSFQSDLTLMLRICIRGMGAEYSGPENSKST
jgi:hypothetical protein